MGQFIYSKSPLTSITYIATGGEGNLLPLPQLLNRHIDLVTYNSLVLIPEQTNPPDSQGWFYDSDPASPTFGDLIFGINLMPTDVVQILFS
jgi:hypothetical protein